MTSLGEGGDDINEKKPHIGSSLDDFLKKEGMLAEARATELCKRTNPAIQSAEKLKSVEVVEEGRDHHGYRWARGNFVELVSLVSYQRTLPPNPNPAAGRIYPLNVHGSVVLPVTRRA